MNKNLLTAVLPYLVFVVFGYSLTLNAQNIQHTTSADQANIFGALSKKWNHGSPNCSIQDVSSFDILSISDNTHILRQDKCDTFEAPFLYLLEGENRSLLLDTGAIEEASTSSLIDAIAPLLNIRKKGFSKPLLVAHTHSHLDHVSGDIQFSGFENVTVVEPSRSSIIEHFAISDWPNGLSYIELGNRNLVIIPTPGHHKDAIAIYDPLTQFLLTGDSLYPGQIYVRNWEQYRDSIIRLSDFARTHNVKAVLGAHIEMTSKQKVLYPIGTTYQPEEAILPLSAEDLHMLADFLKENQGAKELKFYRFTITPMSFLQKTLNNILGLFY